MNRTLPAISRPFASALGIFIVLNLALALQRPELPVTSIWLDASIPEPWLSLFAGVLGACLLVPHHLGSLPWVRWLTAGVFAGFAILTLERTYAFYDELHRGAIATDFPAPLSCCVGLILILEFVRVRWWKAREPLAPPPARVFLWSVAALGAFFLLNLAHVVTYGHRDFRSRADAAVILGAKVYPDGTPCDALLDRLDTGLELYRDGLVDVLIMSGAIDANGQSEPEAMLRYAVTKGVPASRILLDESGTNTRASAVGCEKIATERGLVHVLAVTQYFHCARVKMIFEREGLSCSTVPTCSRRTGDAPPGPLSREGYFLFREAVAFPFYLIYYR
jgi:vancomycin permeability regulator SanA